PRIIASERRRSARCVVDPFGKGQGTRLSRCDVKEVNVGVAIYVRAVGKKLAVGRETLTRDFPLVVRQPADLLACDLEQADVVIAIPSVGRDQNALAVG